MRLMSRFCAVIAITSLILSVLAPGHARAEVAGPGWFSVQGDPVSPEEAKGYYDLKRKSMQAQASKTGMGKASFTASSAETTDEITELAGIAI